MRIRVASTNLTGCMVGSVAAYRHSPTWLEASSTVCHRLMAFEGARDVEDMRSWAWFTFLILADQTQF